MFYVAYALSAQFLETLFALRSLSPRLFVVFPLQANKGIYLDSTAAKGAVERAHLVHTLAHGLANRPDLSELCHTGIYLEVSQPRALLSARNAKYCSSNTPLRVPRPYHTTHRPETRICLARQFSPVP